VVHRVEGGRRGEEVGGDEEGFRGGGLGKGPGRGVEGE